MVTSSFDLENLWGPLLAACYSVLFSSVLFPCWLSSLADCFTLFALRCLLFAVDSSLLAASFLLFAVLYSLLTSRCSVLFSHCLIIFSLSSSLAASCLLQYLRHAAPYSQTHCSHLSLAVCCTKTVDCCSLLALRYSFLANFCSLGRCRVLGICYTLLASCLSQLLTSLSRLFP